MLLKDVQTLVRNQIATLSRFAVGEAAVTVLLDMGHATPQVEKALSEKGYVIGVWPPVRGDADPNSSGDMGLLCRVVVRLEFEPVKLAAQATPALYCTEFLQQVIEVVLAYPPDAGGTKFELAQDAFEMTNFDEGILAFHIRFNKFVVFGA